MKIDSADGVCVNQITNLSTGKSVGGFDFFDDDVPFLTKDESCLTHSISFLLGIDREVVPDFHLMGRAHWKSALVDWIESIGKTVSASTNAPTGRSIAVGKHSSGLKHAVVVNNGEFVFDPDDDQEFLDSIDYFISVND
ncbi:hypothetical protein [Reinekea sp. G2M2-21]|uniref:hypothetical protein n=1 Tax=Reinekea sp. G2M2-21 TaxID=2788942 RepID=UPI0018AA592E|nr:hypothetical protein [Reinekea sp. G2M2-21]